MKKSNEKPEEINWHSILNILIHHDIDCEDYELVDDEFPYIVCFIGSKTGREINLRRNNNRLYLRIFDDAPILDRLLMESDVFCENEAALIAAHEIRGYRTCEYCTVRS